MTTAVMMLAAAVAAYRVDFRSRLSETSHFGTVVASIGTGDVNFYTRNRVWDPQHAILTVPEDFTGTIRPSVRAFTPHLEVEISDVSLAEVTPICNRENGFTLGSGERLVGNRYEFRAPFAVESRSWSRPLEGYRKAVFSFGHFCVRDGGELRYSHELNGRAFSSAAVTITLRAPKTAVRTCVEFSADGNKWVPGADIGMETGARIWRTVPVPALLLPARKLLVRVCAADGVCDVLGYAFEAAFDGESAPETHGWTKFPVPDHPERDPDPSLCALVRDDFGALVPGDAPNGLRLWTCSSGWKVSRDRKAPTRKCRGVYVQTAANEAEAVQLVLRSAEILSDVRVTTSDLIEKGGSRIPSAALDILRVGYVFVEDPTDWAGCTGWWPDPLPPQTEEPLAMAADSNQPFWIRVKPPKGTPRGAYHGTLKVEGRRSDRDLTTVDVPLTVEVFGFDFPENVTCETAVGLPYRSVAAYHRITDRTKGRAIYARYLKTLSDAHLSPYDWWGERFATWGCTWKNPEQPEIAEPVFDWTEWDREMDAARKAYRFNTFALRIACMEPKYCGYPRGSREYEILAGKYLRGVERHLEEKGLLDVAYVYWIDEPTPSAYPHVMKGMDLLRRHAPRLRRMLTATPCPELEGAATIWNPISPYLHSPYEAHCRAKGERFWWYICNDPVAPYAGEFVDHAGVDLRVWLWQTWGEKVEGILIWEVGSWNGLSVYPDPTRLQNPWMDVASWNGTWFTSNGNCAGRYLYPPRACFHAGAENVTDEPVVSQRFEMLRDGIEDYEYFAILRRLDPKSPLLNVPTDVYRSLTEFSVDPAGMERHRIRLARAIEKKLKVQTGELVPTGTNRVCTVLFPWAREPSSKSMTKEGNPACE